MFILDTDIVSNLRKKNPHPNLIHWIGVTGWENMAIAVMTVVEIQIGIERARRSHAAVGDTVQRWLDGMLAVGRPQVVDFGTDAALILGRMYTTPALRTFIVNEPTVKKAKTGIDLAIAAIAIACGAVVATNNGRDFLAIHDHFPLPGLYSPFEGEWLVMA